MKELDNVTVSIRLPKYLVDRIDSDKSGKRTAVILNLLQREYGVFVPPETENDEL